MQFNYVMEEAYKKGYAKGFEDGKREPGKRGHWITHKRGLNIWAECSECLTCGSPHWKVCPVCEARMVEPSGK